MSAENAWRITVEAVSDAVSDMEFWRGKAAEEFSTTVSSRIRSLPMPPAFRAEVEAEAEELRGMLAEATAAWEAALALEENTSPFGGELMRDRIERTIERAKASVANARALLSRLEAKGESQ